MNERTALGLQAAAAALLLAFVAQALGYTFERLLVERAGGGEQDGIAVEVSSVYPGPRDDLELRVTDRLYQPDPLVLPGSIVSVEVRAGGERLQPLTFTRGTTATATLTVRPARALELGRVALDVRVAHVRHGGRPMRELRDTTHVAAAVEIYDARARFWGQLEVAGQAWGFFLLWFFIVLVTARRYRQLPSVRGHAVDVAPFVIALAGGAAVGDVVFARPVLLSFGHHRLDARVALLVVWLGLPLLWLWIQAHRRPAKAPWLPDARARQRHR